jgi:hypothetical protein
VEEGGRGGGRIMYLALPFGPKGGLVDGEQDPLVVGSQHQTVQTAVHGTHVGAGELGVLMQALEGRVGGWAGGRAGRRMGRPKSWSSIAVPSCASTALACPPQPSFPPFPPSHTVISIRWLTTGKSCGTLETTWSMR